MSATNATVAVPGYQSERSEEHDTSRTVQTEHHVGPSFLAAAVSSTPITTSAVVLAGVNHHKFHRETHLSTWLNNVMDFCAQQFFNYIAGLSEKMEKLEYY